MKRKVRLRLDAIQRDLAGEKLAPEVEAIALGRIDLKHRSAAKLVTWNIPHQPRLDWQM